MSEMNIDDSGSAGPIGGAEEVVSLVWEYLRALRNEISEMQGASSEALISAVDDTLQPLAETLDSAEEYTEIHGAATTYLFMVRLFIMPRLRVQRRDRLQPMYEDLAERLDEFRRRHAPLTPDQVVLAEAVAHGLEAAGQHLASRLEHVSDQLHSVESTIKSIPGQSSSGGNPASLSSISAQLENVNSVLDPARGPQPGGSSGGLSGISNQLSCVLDEIQSLNTTITEIGKRLVGQLPAS